MHVANIVCVLDRAGLQAICNDLNAWDAPHSLSSRGQHIVCMHMVNKQRGQAIAGVDVQARLRAFHKQHYGADNMRIVISSDHTLSEMESMLRQCCEVLPPAAGPLPDYSAMPYPFDCTVVHALIPAFALSIVSSANARPCCSAYIASDAVAAGAMSPYNPAIDIAQRACDFVV